MGGRQGRWGCHLLFLITKGIAMTNGTEILLIEDNPEDVEITLRAFHKHHIANKVHVCETAKRRWNACSETAVTPSAVHVETPNSSFLTSSCPKWMGWKSCKNASRTHGPKGSR